MSYIERYRILFLNYASACVIHMDDDNEVKILDIFHCFKVGTKAQSATKLSSKNQWRVLRKDASGEWDLTLYLPEIPVPNGWKALTHPLLKDHGELHKKLMSECGCKISIEGLKNENEEVKVYNYSFYTCYE